MAIDKKSLALGFAIGGKWNCYAQTGDLCVMGPVIYSIEIKRPYSISDAATALSEGVSLEELLLVSASAVFHGVTVFSDAAAALAEELSDEQHDITGAYLYTGEVQEVSMNSNTNENMNDEEIAVTGVTMEVDI